MSDFNTQSHWLRAKALMVTTIVFWMAFSLGMPMWAVLLNEISAPYLDFPIGFVMTTQGALVPFLLILHLFARQQDRIDRDHFSGGQ